MPRTNPGARKGAGTGQINQPLSLRPTNGEAAGPRHECGAGGEGSRPHSTQLYNIGTARKKGESRCLGSTIVALLRIR